MKVILCMNIKHVLLILLALTTNCYAAFSKQKPAHCVGDTAAHKLTPEMISIAEQKKACMVAELEGLIQREKFFKASCESKKAMLRVKNINAVSDVRAYNRSQACVNQTWNAYFKYCIPSSWLCCGELH